MKMQIATLPNDQFILVLSEVDDMSPFQDRAQLTDFRNQVGACFVFVASEPVDIAAAIEGDVDNPPTWTFLGKI